MRSKATLRSSCVTGLDAGMAESVENALLIIAAFSFRAFWNLQSAAANMPMFNWVSYITRHGLIPPHQQQTFAQTGIGGPW